MSDRMSPRITLLIIAGLFFLPLVLAWLAYTDRLDLRPETTRNLGELVQPPLPVPWTGVSETGTAGRGVEPVFHDHWLVLHALPPSCAEACLRDVVGLRQVHRTLGREQPRVRLALLHDLTDPAALQAVRQVYPAFHLLEDSDGRLWQTLAGVAGRASPGATARGARYLIDPLGNIMLFYAAGSDPNHLKKDLERLLTWSKLDEQP